MHARSAIVTAVLAAGLWVPLAGTALAADRDCADFASQAEAQAAFNANPSDPENLDGDDDGQACEEYGYTSGGQVSRAPSGGIAAGDGSAAGGDAPPYVLGGLALTAAGGAAYAARRTARGSA